MEDDEIADQVAAFKASLLQETDVGARIRQAYGDPALAERAGFLTKAPFFGGRAIPNPATISAMVRAAKRLREYKDNDEEPPNVATESGQVRLIQELFEVGRPTAEWVKWIAKSSDASLVPTAALQDRRGPDPQLDRTGKLTYEHLVVLILLVNCGQKTASERSHDGIAAFLRALPKEGQPIPLLVAYLETDATEKLLKEYLPIARSSPGPVAGCTAEHVRAGIKVINESPTIPSHTHLCTPSGKRTQRVAP